MSVLLSKTTLFARTVSSGVARERPESPQSDSKNAFSARPPPEDPFWTQKRPKSTSNRVIFLSVSVFSLSVVRLSPCLSVSLCFSLSLSAFSGKIHKRTSVLNNSPLFPVRALQVWDVVEVGFGGMSGAVCLFLMLGVSVLE